MFGLSFTKNKSIWQGISNNRAALLDDHTVRFDKPIKHYYLLVSWIILFSLAPLCSQAETCQSFGTELIVNGGFEDAYAHWTSDFNRGRNNNSGTNGGCADQGWVAVSGCASKHGACPDYYNYYGSTSDGSVLITDSYGSGANVISTTVCNSTANNSCWASALADHTSGTGFSVYIDPNDISGEAYWMQTISVAANTSYEFSAWIMVIEEDPNLEFRINGVSLTGGINLDRLTGGTNGTDVWQEVATTWNSSTTSGAVVLELVNLTAGCFGNDIRLDDVSFREIITICDTDGDGIADADDLDDDNDGIPDVVECDTQTAGSVQYSSWTELSGSGNTSNTGNFTIGTETIMASVSGTNLSTRATSFSNLFSGLSPALPLQVNMETTINSLATTSITFNGDVLIDPVMYLFYDDTSGESFDLGQAFTILDQSSSGTSQTGTEISFGGSSAVLVQFSGKVGIINITYKETGFPTSLKLTFQLGSDQVMVNCDLDNDGICNTLDIDSDNDGITDITEAGGTDANGDGQVDYATPGDPMTMVDADNDGLFDTVDDQDSGSGGGEVTTGTPLPLTNTDGTGNPDYLDIDADDDGIVDNTEAQSTDGYVAPTTDSDGDGLNDAYEVAGTIGAFGGVGISPENTEGTGNPDYQDTDTDDDGIVDTIEGHDTNGDGVVDGSDAPAANTGLAGGTADADGDGLLDGFDNNTASTDPTNSSLNPESHPDVQGNTLEQDWREGDAPSSCSVGYVESTTSVSVAGNGDAIILDSGVSNSANTLGPPDGSVAYVNGTDALILDLTDEIPIGEVITLRIGALASGNLFVESSSDNATYSPATSIAVSGAALSDYTYTVSGSNARYLLFTVSGGADLDFDGISYSYSSTAITCLLDTDNDGIANSDDLDDDNDGIPDVNECFQSVLINDDFETYDPSLNTIVYGTAPNRSFQFNQADVDGWSTIASDGQIEIWESGHNGGDPAPTPSYSGGSHAEICANEQSQLYQDLATIPGSIVSWSIWHRGRRGVDNAIVLIGEAGMVLVQQASMSTDNSAWVNYTGTYTVPAGQTTTRFGFESISTSSGDAAAGNFIDLFAVEVCQDSDYDGIADPLDLDSDNDGIPDIVEAGGTDSNGDGQVDYATPGDPMTMVDADNDGLFDTVDDQDSGSGGGEVSAGTPLPLTNTDGMGNPDYLDIDADDDGIVDNTEAQTTTGYVTPSGMDTDMDGLDDAYDTDCAPCGSVTGVALVPTNSDTDGDPDYVDTDTDGDGINDVVEGHDTNGDVVVDGTDSPAANTGLAGGTTDADGDGLLDGFDNNTASYDPTNGSLNPESHPDVQGGTAEQDWREGESNSTEATNDFVNTPFNVQVNSSVLANDRDLENHTQTVTALSVDSDGDGLPDTGKTIAMATTVGGVDADGSPNANAGTLTQNADGSYNFTPTAGFVGTVHYEYTVCDNASPPVCDSALVLVEVLPPSNTSSSNVTASPDVFVTEDATTVTSNILANDTDPEGGTSMITNANIDTDGDGIVDAVLTLDMGTQVAGVDESGAPVANAGTLTMGGNGIFTFVPTPGFTGTVTAEYEITDTDGDVDTAPLIIDVIADIGNEIFATDDSALTDSEAPVSNNLTTNDTDPESHLFTVTGLNVDTDGDGLVDADHSADIDGTTSITVAGTDGNGDPVVNAGILIIDADGSYTFTPAAGFAGNVNVCYTICDNQMPQACDVATLEISVLEIFRDYGDAPASYPDAWHRAMVDSNTDNVLDGTNDVWLGMNTNFEGSQPSSATAEGDSFDDAMNFGNAVGDFPMTVTASTSYKVAITVNSSAPNLVYYGMWIDWDNDGTYDDFHNGSKTTASPAVDTITITAPATYTSETVNVRVRADDSSLAIGDFIGGKTNGEVEDFQALVVLPVDLSWFRGEVEDCDVKLSWASQSEISFDHYEIQGSKDGVSFEKMGIEMARGGIAFQRYNYLAKAPQVYRYYRLKIVDTDDRYEYSSVISIHSNCDNEIPIKLYPNPIGKTDPLLNVEFTSNIGEVLFSILDAKGQEMRSFIMNAQDRSNTLKLDISKLPSGVYYLHYKGFEGTHKIKQFIVQE